MIEKIKRNKKEIIFVFILLAIISFAHAFNMFHFPYYENDEGVYMSQSWSLRAEGKLAPYTYWYDHAPAGWIFISGWTALTGGYYTFGDSINTGRVFILLLHMASLLMVYFIIRRSEGSALAGGLAMLLYGFSPLELFFGRRVLLDNIMAFWILASFAILFLKKMPLRHVIASALLFGIAVLTKENAVFFAPALIFCVYKRSSLKHKRIYIAKWLVVSGIIVSLYLLYALLKGEFFPVGFLGNMAPHVSLLETLKFQSSRGGGSIFTPQNSDFWRLIFQWIGEDRFLMIGGIITTVMLGLFSIWQKKWKWGVLSMVNMLFFVFLMRGGLVLEFYVLPILPFFAISIALTLDIILQKLCKKNSYVQHIIMTILFFCVLSYPLTNNIAAGHNVYLTNQTKAQTDAIEWIRNYFDSAAVILIDNYAYLDLKDPKNPSGKYFENAEWYWKVDNDRDISDGLLHGDYKNIEAMAVTPQMRNDSEQSGLVMVSRAMNTATPIKYFSSGGWSVEMWISKLPQNALQDTWKSYKQDFIVDGKSVIDPAHPNEVISEAQAYALLRAVWLNDKETFDNVYAWTKQEMQTEKGTYAWKVTASGSGYIKDAGTATDADQDIALALSFAYKRWNNASYNQDAKQLIGAIWDNEVAIDQNEPYLTAGNWANSATSITFNPSYFSPAYYRIFAEEDTDHPWLDVVKTTYQVLEKCTQATIAGEKGKLPPEWCELNKKTREFSEAKAIKGENAIYGFNAFRVPWRVALDAIWYNSVQGKEYLETLNFLQKEWDKNGFIKASYTHDAKVWDNYESVAAYGANLGYFIVTNPKAAQDIYSEKIYAKLYINETRSYWDVPDNYYTQNWAWFGTSLYNGTITNLWKNGE